MCIRDRGRGAPQFTFLATPLVAVAVVLCCVSYHSGANFTTYDRDNDQAPYMNCCNSRGGFWYKFCGYAMVNMPWRSMYFHWYGLASFGSFKLLNSRMWLKCKPPPAVHQ